MKKLAFLKAAGFILKYFNYHYRVQFKLLQTSHCPFLNDFLTSLIPSLFFPFFKRFYR